MNEDDVVVDVLRRLEALSLEYMIVGSYASNVWGRLRGSHDADIVVKIGTTDAERFYGAFAEDFAIELEPLKRDLAEGVMFNLIPYSGAFKVDVIPVRKTPYAEEEFGRRRSVRVFNRSVWVASPEDTILFKLVWFRNGGEVSGRQLEDARDVFAVQRPCLDESYLNRWADALGVRDLLDRIGE